MSYFFKLPVDRVEREFEVTGAGELIVHNYDLAWDDMLGAMGGEKSGVRALLDEWQADPIKVICFCILSSHHPEMLRIAVDWAEHILRLTERKHRWFLGSPETISRRLKESIGLVQDFASGKLRGEGRYNVKQRIGIAESDVSSIKQELNDLADATLSPGAYKLTCAKKAYDGVAAAVLRVLNAASWVFENVTYDFMVVISVQEVAVYASGSRRYLHPDPYRDPDTMNAGEVGVERRWQIRHFAHAMECVQAGKAWPAIEETP